MKDDLSDTNSMADTHFLNPCPIHPCMHPPDHKAPEQRAGWGGTGRSLSSVGIGLGLLPCDPGGARAGVAAGAKAGAEAGTGAGTKAGVGSGAPP